MDRDQHELQNYGFCGIYRESFNIIFTWKKIFAQIALVLILPLSVTILVHSQVSDVLFAKVLGHDLNFDGNYKRRLRNEWIAFCFFKIAYFIVVLILSLLSIAAVVYTIACIYTAKPVTFKKVMRVVPKVWKRLTVTFLWSFLVFYLYNLVAGGLLAVWIFVEAPTGVKITTTVIFLVVYVVGFVYIAMVWQLASVVSVLEDVYGRKAVVKGKKLMKGKMTVAVECFVVLLVVFIIVEVFYELCVVFKWTTPLAHRIVNGIESGVLLFLVILYGLVVQTVLYFVCKAYHHESVDKSALSEHLEAYLGEYVPLRRDVQLQQVQV